MFRNTKARRILEDEEKLCNETKGLDIPNSTQHKSLVFMYEQMSRAQQHVGQGGGQSSNILDMPKAANTTPQEEEATPISERTLQLCMCWKEHIRDVSRNEGKFGQDPHYAKLKKDKISEQYGIEELGV